MAHESIQWQSKNLLPGTILVMTTHPSLRKVFLANAIRGYVESSYGKVLSSALYTHLK